MKRLTTLGIRCYRHYPIAGYPSDVQHIVSDEGLGKNEYVETTHPLVVVTAPGPGSGKMATCLSQLYHDYNLPHLEPAPQASGESGLRGGHGGSERREHD